LAQLLRADLLPEAWIAPRPVRQLRALLRHRAGLVRLRTRQQNRIHAVVADFGYDRSGSYLSGPGRGWLAGLELSAASREIVAGCLAVIDGLAPVTGRIDGELRQHARADPRAGTLTTLPGAGQFTALVMLAETGDITRFGSARKLASWAAADPDRARLGPSRPARAHSRAGLSLAAVGAEPGGADRQAVAGVRRHLCRHCPSAAGRRSPPSRSPASC
jgi:transposase